MKDNVTMLEMGRKLIDNERPAFYFWAAVLTEFEELLKKVEHITRSPKFHIGESITTYGINNKRMDDLAQIVKKHLGEPYVIKGGRTRG